jgi:hypothetical protein
LNPVARFVGDRLEDDVADGDQGEQNEDADPLPDVGR